MRIKVLQLCGGENRMEGWMGMVHLPWGDVREAPTIERSFHAGETESVFEPHDRATCDALIMD